MENRDKRGAERRGGEEEGRILARVVVLFLVIIWNCAVETRQCSVGLTTPGYTWPSGDIVLEHGNSLRILCILNQSFIENFFPGKNSSDLVFFKGYRPIEPEFITILNETAISLKINKPPPENAMYYCKLRLDRNYTKDYEAVCLNKVVVGHKPGPPTNFSCVSHNWENLTCSWEPPDNYVDTCYSITFKLPGKSSGRKQFPCPSDTRPPETGKERLRNTCFWDSTTNPIYRQPYEYYTFNLTGENVLGTWYQLYKFNHFANVIPARPTNLTVINKTLDTAMLHWIVPFPMDTFPKGLHHRIIYQDEWSVRYKWQSINITEESHNRMRYYNLTGLKYANAVYDVRVFIKSAVASGEDKWSNYSGITFRTPPRVPGQSPRTDVGSFEISENSANRDVYLYWQSIPPWLQNGDNFTYLINQVDELGKRLPVEPLEMTRSYAKFRGLGLKNGYHFEVVSSNAVGILDKPAKIFVPGRSSMPKEPVSFTKIAFEDGLYELSWKPPIGGDDNTNTIANYTIFWCENDKDRPYQCSGYLDWVHVPNSTVAHNITVPEPNRVYQFAISANSRTASSGMMWASCTVIHSKVVGKMKAVWINRIGSSFIEVGWKLDCSDRIGIVEGFKIYYCPIVSPYNLTCKEPKLNMTIKGDVSTIRGEVTELKPYTTYMIAVSVLTKNGGEGQHSDPLYNTTLESPPSDSPRDVVVSNVTNTTLGLEWKPPLYMNGVLRYYVVYCDEHARKVEEESQIELTGLRAHHNYTLRVTACTVDCGPKSAPLHVLTDIGVPDKIDPPLVRFVNSSQVRVVWSKPRSSAGLLDYYQIRSRDGEIHNSTILNTTLSIPDCQQSIGREKLNGFQIRAVNIASNNTHLYGNWSEIGEGNCYINGPSYRVWVIIWVIGSVCGIAFVFCIAYSSKRMWHKCKAMQDVEVKLPPGMAPNMTLLQKTGDQHVRQSSADSSGCSSGQESVTSSLTTDSQMSGDSGAEMDPVPKLLGMLEGGSGKSVPNSPVAWETSSLRQRNVAGGSRSTLDATNHRWDQYSKSTKDSSELIVGNNSAKTTDDSLSLARSTPNLNDNAGYAGSRHTWSSTGYISMPSSEEMLNNPSPVPKEITSPASYSIVGVNPLCSKSDEQNMTRLSNEMETRTTTIPYVSLISLEQHNKDNTEKQILDPLRVFDDLDLSPTKLIPSKESSMRQQYSQAGFLEPKVISPLVLSNRFDPRCKSPSLFTPNSLAEKSTSTLDQHQEPKPYVAVTSIPDTIRKPVATVLPLSSNVTVNSDVSNKLLEVTKGYVAVGVDGKPVDWRPKTNSSVVQMPINVKKLENDSTVIEVKDCGSRKLYPMLDQEIKDESRSSSPSSTSSSTSSLTVCWQPAEKPCETLPEATKKTGYVSLPEQQSCHITKSQQHQQQLLQHLSKSEQQKLLQQQKLPPLVDEQYSKVSVGPRAVR